MSAYDNLPFRGVALGSIVTLTVVAAAAACQSESFDAPLPPLPANAERVETPDAAERDATFDAGERDATDVPATVAATPRPFELTDAIKVGYQPSFDPSRYSKACSANDECAIVPRIDHCGTCCSGDTAVRADGALADLAAVRAGCESMTECSMACGPIHAECFDGGCVVRGSRAR